MHTYTPDWVLHHTVKIVQETAVGGFIGLGRSPRYESIFFYAGGRVYRGEEEEEAVTEGAQRTEGTRPTVGVFHFLPAEAILSGRLSSSSEKLLAYRLQQY